MKKILFHGTGESGFRGIVGEGFGCYNTIWNCSDPNYTYFYELEWWAEHEGSTELEIIRRAFESAAVAAASNRQLSNRIHVLKIEIDDSLIEEDDSCENTDGCVKVDNETLNASNLKVEWYSADYYPNLWPLYMNALMKNMYISLRPSVFETRVLEQLPFVEEMYDFDVEYHGVLQTEYKQAI